MMLKEVLILALVVWMVMPAHPWKPPDYGSKNDDDTSEIDDKPSSRTTRQNLRTRRNYMLHGHVYWDPKVLGSDISRQLRVVPFKEKSAWEKCKELAGEKSMTEGSKNSDDKLNTRDGHSSQNSKRKSRSFRNFMLHGNGIWNPSGQEISRQLRGRYDKKKYGKEVWKAGKKISKPTELNDVISFDYFKSKFNKKYGNESIENERKTIFQNNMMDIEDHNKLFYSGKSSYKKGISEFSDITYNEALNKLSCGKEPFFPDDRHSRFREERETRAENIENNHEDVDYRKCEANNPIRKQKTDSCWAFSVTSSIESQIFLKSKTLPILSEQYLIDCCKEYYECHKSGCMQGGWIDKAITCVKLKGISLGDKHYPKYYGQPRTCLESARKTPYKVYDMERVKQNNEDEVKKALVRWGPISIAILSSTNFLAGAVGVLDDKLCGPKGEVNHAVVLVGYGTEKGKDYWLIRNSYGDTVGDEGYFKLTRDGNSNCNDDTYGYIPMVKLGIQPLYFRETSL